MTLAYAYIDENLHQARWQAATQCASQAFLQDTAAYRRWQDAQLRLLGRLLLQHLLSTVYGLTLRPGQIGKGKHDKPFLPERSIQFNISHATELAVCVVQEHTAVGVDVEAIKPITIEDFHPQMTSLEWERIQLAPDPQRAFYDYWTSKEAILKLLGDGLQRPLKSFEVAAERTQCVVEGTRYYLHPCTVAADYCCYVASAAPIKEVKRLPEWK